MVEVNKNSMDFDNVELEDIFDLHIQGKLLNTEGMSELDLMADIDKTFSENSSELLLPAIMLQKKMVNEAVGYLMPERYRKRAEDFSKPIKLKKWEKDMFLKDLETVTTEEGLMKRVKDGDLSYAQVNALKQINPELYQSSAQKLVEVSSNLEYNQRQAVNKLIGKPMEAVYEDEKGDPQDNRKNKKPARKLKMLDAQQIPGNKGYRS